MRATLDALRAALHTSLAGKSLESALAAAAAGFEADGPGKSTAEWSAGESGSFIFLLFFRVHPEKKKTTNKKHCFVPSHSKVSWFADQGVPLSKPEVFGCSSCWTQVWGGGSQKNRDSEIMRHGCPEGCPLAF